MKTNNNNRMLDTNHVYIDNLKKILLQEKPNIFCSKSVNIDLLRKIFNSVQKNDNEHQTIFPDYVGDFGIIECYQVTSGKDRSKGQEMSKISSNIHKKHIESGQAYNISALSNNSSSLDNLRKSILKNTENHLGSYKKYLNKNKKNLSTIFLLLSDSTIHIYVDSVVDHPLNIYQRYIPSYDIKLLSELEELSKRYIFPDYIIYVNQYRNSCNNLEADIIHSSDIIELIKERKFLNVLFDEAKNDIRVSKTIRIASNDKQIQ